MNRTSSASIVLGSALRSAPQAAVAALLIVGAAELPLRAGEAVIEVGPSARSRVPRWDARGLGPLPWQGIACLDASEDGRWIAVGTTAPPGDPNLFLLDGDGKPVGQHRAGQRWVNEVAVSGDGRVIAGLSTTPEGTAGDAPRFYGCREGKELDRAGTFTFLDFHPGGFLFHYGEGSNQLPRVSRRAGDRWVVAGDDLVSWPSPGDGTLSCQATLGQGVTTAMAASPSGLVVVGRYAIPSSYTPREAADVVGGLAAADRLAATGDPARRFRNLLVVRPDRVQPIVWSRPIDGDVVPSPEPEEGVHGPPAPPYRDMKFQAPLAVAVDAAGERIAVADYQGWQRVFHPRDGSDDIPFGTRFMPSRPTIRVYTVGGETVRRVSGDALPPFWCDLTFSPDGRKLLIWPHDWTSRGLGGQPFLPADEDARTLFVP